MDAPLSHCILARGRRPESMTDFSAAASSAICLKRAVAAARLYQPYGSAYVTPNPPASSPSSSASPTAAWAWAQQPECTGRHLRSVLLIRNILRAPEICIGPASSPACQRRLGRYINPSCEGGNDRLLERKKKTGPLRFCSSCPKKITTDNDC